MSILSKFSGLFKPGQKPAGAREAQLTYCGYELHYSEGTSIVNRFLQTGSYEPETLAALFHYIEEKNGGTFLDIGTNVGLVSLAVLERFPAITIYGFEPGIHQHRLFRKTIDVNRLNDRIHLYPYALNETNGTVDFYIHDTADASGDGLKDTGRAGKAKKVTVKSVRLDDWWKEAKQPAVDVIKCDTEGAELFVLRGGEELINTCRPVMVLEIFHTNLLNYPFDELTIFDWLAAHQYSLYTLGREKVERGELPDLCKHQSEFIAISNV
jgi:FkbM family methyltransferase